MEISLQGKKALVCGSTQGIGKAIAKAMAIAGAEITLMARNESSLKATLSELDTSCGQQHDYLVADFHYPEQVKAKIETYTPQKTDFHILINNTGGPPPGSVQEASEEDFLDAFQLHLVNNQVLTKALTPLMKMAGYGRIINIISTSVKAPIPGLGVSNTIRGAVASWAKTLSNELGPFGITVNNILPGMTYTSRLENLIKGRAEKEMKSIDEVEQAMKQAIPAKRFASADEPAALAVFLASPFAAFINGESIRVDGGGTPSI